MRTMKTQAVLVLALVCAACLAPGSAAAQAVPSPTEGDFAGSVDIGDGRSLWLECRGKGSPTVILENGLRSRGDFWSTALDATTPTPYVLPGIAAFTRVCTYDRPGTTLGTEAFSRSTPVPMPRTARDTVSDLDRLIRNAGLEGPFVLAGHSTGGLIARLYAAAHPRQVAALVQVDALTEDLDRFFTDAQMAAFDDLNNGPIEGLDYPDLERVLFRPSFAELRRALRRQPLANIPVSVITRGLPVELPAGLPAGLTTDVLVRVWAQAQARLARLTPRTRQTIAARSSHYVMFSEPGLIIREVERIVESVRRGR